MIQLPEQAAEPLMSREKWPNRCSSGLIYYYGLCELTVVLFPRLKMAVRIHYPLHDDLGCLRMHCHGKGPMA